MTTTPLTLRHADNAGALPRCVGCGNTRVALGDDEFYTHASNCVESGGALKARFLIGILSAEAYGERRDACRETWMRWLDGHNAVGVFLIGKPDIDKPELFGDELRLPCPDTYGALPQKVRWFCEWAIEHAEFDYLFKCDDDTYVHVPRLLQFGPGLDYVGGRMMGRPHASGGAGYMLSLEAAATIAFEMTEANGVEDKLVCKHLKAAGIGVTYDRRFQPWEGASNEPSPDNDIITGHYCAPDAMQRIHGAFGGSGLVWRWKPDDPHKVAYSAWADAGLLRLTLAPPGTIVAGGPRADLWHFAVMAPIPKGMLPPDVEISHVILEAGFAIGPMEAEMLAVKTALELVGRADVSIEGIAQTDQIIAELQRWLDENVAALP